MLYLDTTLTYKQQLENTGFSIVQNVYTDEEVMNILAVIDSADISKDTFRKSNDLFAIRQFLKEIAGVVELIFTDNLRSVIRQVMGKDFFVVKSIYFDKPASSNWYVPYHQDLTISVDRKIELAGFSSWTVKQNQFSVQPPIHILENIVTMRIHLDDTAEDNGALRVITNSHKRKIYRPETIDWSSETECTCSVPKGGVMLMKPLTLHSSARTTNSKKRRVIHIEFSNIELPVDLQWAERINLSV